MIEVMWIFLIALAVLVGVVVLGAFAALAYYVLYGLFCLVTGRPNKLNITEKTFDTKPEDEK